MKIGFLAKFHAGLTFFHKFPTDFLKIMTFESLIFSKMGQNHVFKGIWDDLEAGIGINIQKEKISQLKSFF